MKSMKVENKTKGEICIDGIWQDFIPKTIRSHRAAYGASLSVLFKHVADFHLHIIEIIAEKYNLDATEMIESVMNDERYKQMITSPCVNALEYFEQGDADKILSDKASPEISTAAQPDAEMEDLVQKTQKILFGDSDNEEKVEEKPKEEEKSAAKPKRKIVKKAAGSKKD